MTSLRFLLPFLLSIVLLCVTACSDMIHERKKYYFSVIPDTHDNRNVANYYFAQFNANFNTDVLHVINTPNKLKSDETSTLRFTPHLSKREGEDRGNLGWGQWVYCTKFSNIYTLLKQPNKFLTRVNTMHLEFDEGKLKKWYQSNVARQQMKARSLFYHELGHGFHLEHDNDRASVMYESINDEDKDLNRFFLKVAKFLQ